MTATAEAVALARTAALAAADKKALDVVAVDVSEQLVITDVFVLCSAPNERQVLAIVDEVEHRARRDHGAKPQRREGAKEGRWVLLDFGDVVVHAMHEQDRGYYGLERLWKDCPMVDLPDPAGPEATRSGG